MRFLSRVECLGFEVRPRSMKTATPTLDALVATGLVWEETPGGEWVGTASDGIIVSVGGSAEEAERYLSANPTPDKW